MSWFHSKLQSVAVMTSSRKCLLEDEVEQSLLEERTASDQSNTSDDDNSSWTDDLTVGEVVGSEYSDDKSDDVQMSYCIHCAYCFECYIYMGGHDKLCRATRKFF